MDGAPGRHVVTPRSALQAKREAPCAVGWSFRTGPCWAGDRRAGVMTTTTSVYAEWPGFWSSISATPASQPQQHGGRAGPLRPLSDASDEMLPSGCRPRRLSRVVAGQAAAPRNQSPDSTTRTVLTCGVSETETPCASWGLLEAPGSSGGWALPTGRRPPRPLGHPFAPRRSHHEEARPAHQRCRLGCCCPDSHQPNLGLGVLAEPRLELRRPAEPGCHSAWHV